MINSTLPQLVNNHLQESFPRPVAEVCTRGHPNLPTDILTVLDLVEFEVEHQWEQFRLAENEAERRLMLYQAALQEREELACAVGAALAEAEAILR